MPRVDLHTHSIASPDGSITAAQYKQALSIGSLDVIAVTDHNTIEFAKQLQQEVGDGKIIIGEEVSTTDGEIIGLYLTDTIPAGLSISEAVMQIRNQGGLVCVPHPFEAFRSGISMQTLERIKESVDMIEAPNGRSLQPKDAITLQWAKTNNIAVCGSSDAHRAKALGKTYTLLDTRPTKSTLVSLLKNGDTRYSRPSLGDISAPKLNRLKKRLKANHD